MNTFWKDVVWDWRRGKHSGLPVCCIVWFLIRSRFGWYRIIERPKIYPVWVKLNHKFNSPPYIRCPHCFLHRSNVGIHICSIECVGMVGCCYRQKEINH